MNQIRDWLWIGDIDDVRTESIDTDVVVTVCQESVEDNVSCEYHYVNMADGESDFYGGDSTYSTFKKAADHVMRAYRSGKSVFVHCHMGQSRSASVVIAVLGATEGRYYDEAKKIVESKRPQIHPNETLAGHAQTYIEEHTGLDHEPSFDFY